MINREVVAYWAACDHCGGAADVLGAEHSLWFDAYDASEAWTEAGGIAISGRHACRNPECGVAVLDAHPDLIARSTANGVGRLWAVFDHQWGEYVMFSAYRGGPTLIKFDRSLATLMDELWEW